MTRISIMQPYFLPYAGYFRLFVNVDAFVIGDVQQFPRRGWVHRNRLVDDLAQLSWLTLPLRKSPLETSIADIQFASDAQATLTRNMNKFAACRDMSSNVGCLLRELHELSGEPFDVIVRLLKLVLDQLGLSAVPIIRQSSLGSTWDDTPMEQISTICRALDATEYVNAPGGRQLYQAEEFRRRGLKLFFLPDYPGSRASILQRLAQESAQNLREDILASSNAEPA